MMVGGEDPMVASEVGTGRRDQDRKATQEFDRSERKLGPAVAQGTLEGEQDPSAVIQREPRVGDRRARAVAAQAFEALAIFGVDEAIGVERVALEERGAAAGPRWRRAAR